MRRRSERYAIVGLGDGAIVARWEAAQPQLVLDPAAFTELYASHPAVSFVVRQLGDADVSPPLTVYRR